VILEQIERFFMIVGDKVIAAGGGKVNFEEYEATSELVIKPRSVETTEWLENYESLNNMTKQQICNLALERYGIDFKFRNKKEILISEFLSLQNESESERST